MSKGAYISINNFTPRALPSGYTQVEYIQSSGTQYINTLVAHSSSSNIVLQADVSYDTVSPSNQIMGFNGSAGNGIGTSGAAWWEASSIANATVGTLYSLEWGVNGSNWHRTVNGKTVTGTRSSTSFTTNLYLFAAQASATSTSMSYYCSCKLYSAKVMVGGNVVRDFVPCKNSSGTAGLYDMANGVFYQNAGTGTFTVGNTYGNKFRKVKKGFITVDGSYRKIKKAFVTVGGQYRPCWSGGELAYYGTITGLSVARMKLAATTVGNYALFGGGGTTTSGGVKNTVDAYNGTLTRTSVTDLTDAASRLAATTVGDYAIFAGGHMTQGVDNALIYGSPYTSSLTRGNRVTLQSNSSELAATSVGNYALFGGGKYDQYSKQSRVTTFTSSLTKGSATALSEARNFLVATTVGNYALFGGGDKNAASSSSSPSAAVDTYNASLTKGTATSLSSARFYLAATTVGNYALFGGGYNGSSNFATVDAYNTSLTKTTVASLSNGSRYLAATRVGKYALFGGGYDGSAGLAFVDVYDESLTKTVNTDLSVGRYHLVGASIGKYALFGGGYTGSASAVVDAYLAEE